MPRCNFRRTLGPRKPQRKIRRQSKRAKTSRESITSGLKSVIVRGIKSVLSVLPFGSITVATANFLFKSIGWSDTVVSTSSATKAISEMDVKIYGVCGMFKVQPRSFSSGLPGLRANYDDSVASGTHLRTNYSQR